MMRRFVLFLLASFTFLAGHSQQNKKERPASAWKSGGQLSVMAGQAGMRNWAPTGSEKFALTASAALSLWANKKWGSNTWENNLDLSYGLIRTHEKGTRKMDDKFDFFSKYGYGLTGITSVGAVVSLRTQLTNGYDERESPRKRVSGFFAPAYLNFSPGIQMQTRNRAFSFHFGPAIRWIIITNSPYSLVYQGGIKPDGSQERTLANLYGVSPGKQVRVEAGPYLTAQFKAEIVKNVMWKTRVELNSDLRRKEPLKIDVYWTNTFAMTVNKWLKVNYNFDLYQDEDVKMFGPGGNGSRTQMKSMLGVGLGFIF